MVWAAAWHGTERHFLPAHRAPLSLSLSLSLFLPLCLQFMCFQTGQSTPLSCAGLSPPLPPTISALSVSVKSHQPSLSLSHTHTYTHYYLQSQTPIVRQSLSALIPFIFSNSVLSILSLFMNLLPTSYLCLSALFCFVHYFANPLLH